MRFEPRRSFAPARSIGTRDSSGGLPAELAFLESFGVSRETLADAVVRARREGVDPHRALLSQGTVSQTLYYRALSLHLGVPFIESWPQLAHPIDPSGALRRGVVRLAAGGRAWLLAPEAPTIRALLKAKAIGPRIPDIAIATPAHFAALVCHRARPRIALRASDALPDIAPFLSARGASTLATLGTLAICAIVSLLVCLSGAHIESDAVCVVFLAALVFRLFVVGEGLAPPEPRAHGRCDDTLLPTYSLLVPLRDEACMIADLVASLAALDYPASKREVLFLVEPDDPSTRAALAALRLPSGFTIVDLPPGEPRTKPRALNVGLLLARGGLVTVYDAEDRPEPDQLRRAAALFATAPDMACLQARLAIANGSSGLLARVFAIEYASLFDIFNPGLARLGLPIALGGTSNHFRAAALRSVGGWDAWNVTEDADLGLRLARFGYKIGMLESTTWEDAPERLGTWFKQRRRWTKGWVQTLVVLLREPRGVVGELGPRRALAVALLLTNLVAGPLLTPFFLAIVLWHLAVEGLPAPRGGAEVCEATLAFSVIGLGAAGTLWIGWLGARRRCLPVLTGLTALLPYQLMIAFAAWGGIWDLVRRPHHWHKTPHGASARAITPPASAAAPRA